MSDRVVILFLCNLKSKCCLVFEMLTLYFMKYDFVALSTRATLWYGFHYYY